MYSASEARLAHFWPTIIDKASAEQAARLGFVGAAWAAAGSAIISALSIAGVSAGNEWAWIDALIFIILAWRIRRFSKTAISIALALFLIGYTLVLVENPNGAHIAGVCLPVCILLMGHEEYSQDTVKSRLLISMRGLDGRERVRIDLHSWIKRLRLFLTLSG